MVSGRPITWAFIVPFMAYLLFIEGWFYTALSYVPFGDYVSYLVIGGVILLAMAIVAISSFVDEDDEDVYILPMLRSFIFASSLAIAAYYVFMLVDSWEVLLRQAAWMVPFVLFGWVAFVYFQHRSDAARASTAVGRTQRTVNRTVTSYSEAIFGAVVVVLTFGLAVASGLGSALSTFGDALLPFAPEGAYLFTTLVGYVQLGGEWRYAWLIPSLDPLQWVGLALGAGFLAVVIRDA
jgi:hypothetical protein